MTRLTKSFTALRRLKADESGTSVLELALCTPVLVTFVVGIIDVAMYADAKLKVSQAVFRGLEVVQAGTTAQTEATVKSEVAAAAGYGVTTGTVAITKELYCDDGDAPEAAYDGACAAGETVSRYITIRATGTYSPLIPSMTSNFFSNARVDGTVPLTAHASLRVQ